MKQCGKCKEWKELGQFHFQKKRNQHYSQCYACKNESSKQWALNNPEKNKERMRRWNSSEIGRLKNAEWKKNNPNKNREIQRRAKLKNRYGITGNDYNNMLLEQNYSCKICLKHEKDNIVRNKLIKLAVDHDHNTKKIRGLLCDRCNTSIGKFEHNTELLQAAIDYLMKHK